MIPYENQCLHKIKVDEDMGSFVVNVEEEEIPVNYSWLEQVLGLEKVNAQMKVKS